MLQDAMQALARLPSRCYVLHFEGLNLIRGWASDVAGDCRLYRMQQSGRCAICRSKRLLCQPSPAPSKPFRRSLKCGNCRRSCERWVKSLQQTAFCVEIWLLVCGACVSRCASKPGSQRLSEIQDLFKVQLPVGYGHSVRAWPLRNLPFRSQHWL